MENAGQSPESLFVLECHRTRSLSLRSLMNNFI